MYAQEGGDGGIHPGQLHRDEAVKHRTSRWPPIHGVRQPGDEETGDLRDELEGKLGPCPVLVNDRRDRFLRERAYAADNLAVVLVQERRDVVEVAWRRRQASLPRPLAPRFRC